MAKIPIFGATQLSGPGLTAGTNYRFFFNSFNWYDTSILWCRTFSPEAATLSKLTVRVVSNDASGTSTISMNFTTPPSGVQRFSNQTISIPGGATGEFQDSSNTDSISAWDTVALKQIVGTGASNFNMPLIGCSCEFKTITSIPVGTGELQLYGDIAQTIYNLLVGFFQANDTLVLSLQTRLYQPGTIKNLFTYIYSNAQVADMTVGYHINGIPGSCIITVPAGTSGFFKDTTHSDRITATDLVNTYITTQGGGFNFQAAQLNTVGIELQLDGGKFCSIFSGTAPASNSTGYGVIGGAFSSATESDVQIKALADFNAYRIGCYGSNGTGTATLSLRINGNDGNQIISFPTSTAGWFTSSAAADVIAPTDEINYQLQVGAGSGGASVTRVVLIGEPTISTPVAWGEENPTSPENPWPWSTWETSEGVKATILGDQDWGKLALQSGIDYFGPVVDTGDANSKLFKLKLNSYGTGSGDSVPYIRQASSSLDRNYDSGDASWVQLAWVWSGADSCYIATTTQAWQYVQERVKGGNL